MTDITLSLPTMTCGGCAAHVRRALQALPGVTGTRVDLAKKELTAAYDDARVSAASIRQALVEAGYPPAGSA